MVRRRRVMKIRVGLVVFFHLLMFICGRGYLNRGVPLFQMD